MTFKGSKDSLIRDGVGEKRTPDEASSRSCQQAERLQQVAEQKALIEMEYVRKEGDARSAALNTRREPGTQGAQDRVRNDDDDDGIGETAPPEVSARRDMFSGLPEEEIVKIFKNKFKLTCIS